MKFLKVIGWSVFGLVALYLASTALGFFGTALLGSKPIAQSDPRNVQPTSPPYLARVVKVDCTGDRIDSARVVLENRGIAIPDAHVFVEFINGDGSVASVQDSYFNPSTVPAGSLASATLYSRGTKAGKCRVSRVQDGSGSKVDLI